MKDSRKLRVFCLRCLLLILTTMSFVFSFRYLINHNKYGRRISNLSLTISNSKNKLIHKFFAYELRIFGCLLTRAAFPFKFRKMRKSGEYWTRGEQKNKTSHTQK